MQPLPVLLAAAVLAAAPVHAQQRAHTSFPALPAAATAVAPEVAGTLVPPEPPASRTSRFLSRTAAGSLGTVVGAAAVGVGAYAVLPHCDACEDPGMGPLFLGALAGAVLGTAAFAAAPEMRDGCGYGDRFRRALLGSAPGFAAGGLVFWATGLPFAVPIGGAAGSSVATLGCRPRTPAEPGG